MPRTKGGSRGKAKQNAGNSRHQKSKRGPISRARKSTAAKRAKPKSRATPKTSVSAVDELREVKEELAEARAELARIAGEENHARRDLVTQVSLGRSVEERLRDELEAVRIDLRTALADLEIARADHQRAEAKLLDALREASTARENERLASHASADTRDQLLDLQRENERLQHELENARRPIQAKA
jgi:hypothetical protein